MQLRPYDPVGDRAAVDALWATAIAPAWPVLPGAIDRIGDGLVACVDGETIGFVATGVGAEAAGIALLIVAPHRQRRGIGTALLDAAVDRLPPGRGVHAGRGGAAHIWPGVPLDLPAGVAFFAGRGWTSEHDCADLTQDLRDYHDPEPLPAVHAELAAAGPHSEAARFVAEHFPEWLRYYQDPQREVVAAREPDRRMVGTLLFSGPDASHPYRPALGELAGSIGCVGVAPDAQGRGVGTAMVAHASRVLRDRGTRTCLIDWVVRESFYARLGYHSWRRYRMYTLPSPGAGVPRG